MTHNTPHGSEHNITLHDLEEVTECQYNHHIAYEQIKYHCTREEAIKVIDRKYIVTEACEKKWLLYAEQLKLGCLRTSLNRR